MVKIGQIFTIQRNNKKVRWKVIEHPYFDGELVLVKDYAGLYGTMRSGYSKEDDAHICGKTSLETAYDDAYLMT